MSAASRTTAEQRDQSVVGRRNPVLEAEEACPTGPQPVFDSDLRQDFVMHDAAHAINWSLIVGARRQQEPNGKY